VPSIKKAAAEAPIMAALRSVLIEAAGFVIVPFMGRSSIVFP
jgi:hypothetical protein